MNKFLLFLIVIIGCQGLSKDSKFDGALYQDHLDEMNVAEKITDSEKNKIIQVVKLVRDGKLDRTVVMNSTYKGIIEFYDTHDELFNPQNNTNEKDSSSEEQVKELP